MLEKSIMGRPTMITLVLMASMFVVVKCCESNDECENGCCYRGTCSQTILCDLQKRLERLKTCVFDSDCSTGCCGSDGKCKAGYDYGYGCSPHSSCSFNWDCPGAQCCENGRCEDSATQCTFGVPIPISTTQFSWLDRFNIKTTAEPFDDNDYNNNNDYDNNDYDNDYDDHPSHSSYSSGKTITIAIICIVAAFFKISLWVVICARRRHRRVVLLRVRRTACVQNETVAPIIQHDATQVEHARLHAGILNPRYDAPQGPPPAYTPTNEDTTQNAGEDPPQDSGERAGDTGGARGPAQAAPVGPPPEYTPRHPSSVESNASSEANTEDATQNPTPGQDVTRSTEEMPDVPPQSISIPPPPHYSP